MTKKVKIIIWTVVGVIILVTLSLVTKETLDIQTQKEYKKDFNGDVSKYTEQYDVEEDLVYAIIKTGSNFDNNAVSEDGKLGLMMISEEDFNWIKREIVRTDPRQAFNIEYNHMTNPKFATQYGAVLINHLKNKYKDEPTLIAAYHAGQSKVDEWLADSEISSDGKLKIEKIPSEETKEYVKKVLEAKKIYANIY